MYLLYNSQRVLIYFILKINPRFTFKRKLQQNRSKKATKDKQIDVSDRAEQFVDSKKILSFLPNLVQ